MVMISSLGAIDSAEAQRMLLWYVMKRPRSSEEVEEVYMHLITKSQPIPQFVTYLEKECFGAKFEKHGKKGDK
jgi:L-fucose mutarotase/ribose pyranase (RbsD/FucU family)